MNHAATCIPSERGRLLRRKRARIAALLATLTGVSCQHLMTSGALSDGEAKAAPVPLERETLALDAAASMEMYIDPWLDQLAEVDDVDVRWIAAELRRRHTGIGEQELVPLARVIVEEAHRHALEPALVMAVIEVESSGYHMAVSTVGALGLMQLLPSTAKEVAEKLDIPWYGPDTLFDPAINVRLGAAYLRTLADRYDGNVTTALAAYNWGPGRIDRRLRRGNSVPQLYITKVMTAYDDNGVPELLAQRS